MDLNDVAVFVRVAEQGNFSNAARSLNLTPSTVSKAIARLENDLRRRLFLRSSRTMAMTFEGEAFYEAAQRLLAAVDEAEAAGASAVAGTLRVRCIPGFAHHQLAPAMPALRERYPDLRVEFTVATERSVHLDDGADVAITSGAPPLSNLIARSFSSARWVICASPDYLAKAGVPTEPSQLAGHACLNFPPTCSWSTWSDPDSDGAGYQPDACVVANQSDTLLAMARAGAGIVRLPEYAIASDLQAGRLARVFPSRRDGEEPLILLYQARRHLSPRIRAFITFVNQRFADRPWRVNSPVAA